jgi:2,4-dienoyl-CoA reductase-like NADH-dependent reductase (Old Yellow Enzyme family)
LEISEIKTIVQDFIKAGDRAARAGCDALEIHATHGYLLHHFIDRITNRRHDAYGGSIGRRYRILAEIRDGLRSKHPNLPVLLRLSLRPDDDFPILSIVIQEAGFDAVDVRTGFSSMPKSDNETPVPPGYTLELARKLRPYLNLPLMTGGRILTLEQAEQAVLEVGLDAIVLGRPLLADPDWARKALSGETITLCRYDCEPSCYGKFKEGELLHCVYYGRQE